MSRLPAPEVGHVRASPGRAITRAGLHWREFQLAISLVDAGLTVIGIMATVALWDALPIPFVPTPLFGVWIIGTWFLWIFALRVGGAYDLLSPEVDRGHVASIVRAGIIVSAATLMAYFLAPFAFPRGVALTSPLVVLVLLLVWRAGIAAELVGWSAFQRRLLMLGLDESTTRLASILTRGARRVPYRAMAFVTDTENPPPAIGAVPVLSGSDQLWRTVTSLGIAEIAVGQLEGLPKSCQAELVDCFNHGVGATDARRLYEDLTGRVLIGHAGPNWYAELPTIPRRPYAAVKRVIDVVSSLLLLVILLPLIAAIALLVVLDDGYPSIYRQIRLGRRGEPYTIHKFRTMRLDAEIEGAAYAQVNDPRTTRLGRFLRPSGLDELPQLWDVLRGRMSLVGPRPERPEFVAQLVRELPLYKARLLVRPGVVGWAEVHVPHAVTLKDHLTRLEYDLFYVKHSGLVMDINIVLRTIGLLASGRRWARASTVAHEVTR